MTLPGQEEVWSHGQALARLELHCGSDECPLSPPHLQSAPAAAAHTDAPPALSSAGKRGTTNHFTNTWWNNMDL